MRKAVLFDLDDTIFDHQHSRRAALGALKLGYSAIADRDIRIIESAHERHLQTTYALLLAGRISSLDARRERMRLLFADFGLALSTDQLSEADNLYRRAYDANRQPVPGVMPLITALKRTMKIAVVTNGLVIDQEEKIRLCGLDGKINVVAISEKIGIKSKRPTECLT